MNWGMFFGGIDMIIAAFLLRRIDIWAYGKDGEERDDYNLMQKVKDKFFSILLIIGGVIVIFVSFAP